MDYSRFQTVYANLPDKVRNEIIVIIEGKPYTWNAAFLEISSDTTLGKSIFQKLVEMEII